MTPAERRVFGRHLIAMSRERYRLATTWCCRFYAVDAQGLEVSPTDGRAVAWCPRGLLWRNAFDIGIARPWSVDEPEPPGVGIAEIWLAQAIDPNALALLKPAAVITPWNDRTGAIPPDLIARHDDALGLADRAMAAFELA